MINKGIMDKRSIFEIIDKEKQTKTFFNSHYYRSEQKFIKKVYFFCRIGKLSCYFLIDLVSCLFPDWFCSVLNGEAAKIPPGVH